MKLISSLKKAFGQKGKPKYKQYTHEQLKIIAMKTRMFLQEKYKKECAKIISSDEKFKHVQKIQVDNNSKNIQEKYYLLQQIGQNVIQAESIKIYIQLLRKIQAYSAHIMKFNGDVSLMQTQLKWFQCILWYRKSKNIPKILDDLHQFCFNFFKGVDVTMQLNPKCDIFQLYHILKYLPEGVIVPIQLVIKQIQKYVSFNIENEQFQQILQINRQEIKKWNQEQKKQVNNRKYSDKGNEGSQIRSLKKSQGKGGDNIGQGAGAGHGQGQYSGGSGRGGWGNHIENHSQSTYGKVNNINVGSKIANESNLKGNGSWNQNETFNVNKNLNYNNESGSWNQNGNFNVNKNQNHSNLNANGNGNWNQNRNFNGSNLNANENRSWNQNANFNVNNLDANVNGNWNQNEGSNVNKNQNYSNLNMNANENMNENGSWKGENYKNKDSFENNLMCPSFSGSSDYSSSYASQDNTASFSDDYKKYLPQDFSQASQQPPSPPRKVNKLNSLFSSNMMKKNEQSSVKYVEVKAENVDQIKAESKSETEKVLPRSSPSSGNIALENDCENGQNEQKCEDEENQISKMLKSIEMQNKFIAQSQQQQQVVYQQDNVAYKPNYYQSSDDSEDDQELIKQFQKSIKEQNNKHNDDGKNTNNEIQKGKDKEVEEVRKDSGENNADIEDQRDKQDQYITYRQQEENIINDKLQEEEKINDELHKLLQDVEKQNSGQQQTIQLNQDQLDSLKFIEQSLQAEKTQEKNCQLEDSNKEEESEESQKDKVSQAQIQKQTPQPAFDSNDHPNPQGNPTAKKFVKKPYMVSIYARKEFMEKMNKIKAATAQQDQ